MQANAGKKQQSHVQRGHSGDYVIKRLQDTKAREARFPNRFVVTDGETAGASVCVINPQRLDKLGLFADDVICIKGRFQMQTHAVVQTDEGVDTAAVVMPEQLRKNANVNIGDLVAFYQAELPNYQKLRLLPFDSDVRDLPQGINLFDTYVRPHFEGRVTPVTIGDCITIRPRDETLPDVEFKVVNLEPGPAALIAPGGEFYVEGDPLSREEDDAARKNKIGFSDLGGIDKELGQIKELIQLPLKHPEIFDYVGIKPPKGVLLHGPPGCGKTSIGRAIANETGAFFLVINGPEIMSAMAGESEKNLRMAFQTAEEEAQKSGAAIIFIDEIDVIGGSRENSRGEVEKRVVSQLLTLMDGLKPRSNLIILAATNRPNTLDPALRRFGRFDREIMLGVPDAQGRLDILKLKTNRMKLAEDVDLEWLAENTNGFVGADLGQLVTEGAMQCIREQAEDLDYEEKELPEGFLPKLKVSQTNFKAALKVCNPSTLRETFVEIPTTTWDDVGGLQEIKKKIKEMIQYPIQYSEQYERLGIEASRGCLFFGPPGNGKTLLAKAIANQCQTNFISVKGPELMSMWVGESERGIRNVFDKARQASPCVLFLDELDSIAKHRGGGSGGGEGVGDRMLNQLLTEIDGVGAKKQVFIIGATNRPDTIDPALIRGGRLDQMIYVPMPDYEGRISVLKASLRKSKVSPDVDIQQIAAVTGGYSGADLGEICQKAVQLAIRESVKNFNSDMIKVEVYQKKQEKNKEPIDQNYVDQLIKQAEEKFNSGILTRAVFESAVRQSRQSVSEADMKKYEGFKQQFCDASQGGYSSNPKVANFAFVDNFAAPIDPDGVSDEPQQPAQPVQAIAPKKTKKDDEYF